MKGFIFVLDFLSNHNFIVVGQDCFFDVISCITSPGRPTIFIMMSLSGINPASLIIFLAKSMILTGAPYQNIDLAPLPIAPASSTNWQASGMVMKYLIISGCVIVTGPPLLFVC
jgi:hypothetical protein